VNIYIDESGSFVFHPKEGSWSVVVAVCCPESSRRPISEVIGRLRRSRGSTTGEVKLPHLGESEYVQFLESLAKYELIMFATGTDSGLNTPDRVQAHKAAHVSDIRENIPRMKFEGGRLGMTLLANQLESLSSQLYVQLITQVNLVHDVIGRGINFYVQRKPVTLREFRWRIDQKNTTKTVFEETFEKFAPPLLQARSIQDPMVHIRQFDYRHLAAYEFEEGQEPDYLQTEYGLPPMEVLNVQKLFRGNLKFVDSKASEGVQVADLLASGLRRVLKGAFDRPSEVARAIGRLCVQNVQGKHAINLFSFGDEQPLEKDTSAMVRHIDRESRQFFL
jgi:hypothetical protein